MRLIRILVSLALAVGVAAAAGSAASTSAPTNTGLPGITGTMRDGQLLTAHNGAWTGSPTSFAYDWQRCDDQGGGCTAIAGATSKEYTASPADVGHRLRVEVTASNADGSGSATSRPTDVTNRRRIGSSLRDFRRPTRVAIRLRQHEAVEERSELAISIEREDMRDVLIRPHDDHAPCLPIDAAHCKDVVTALDICAKHLLVIAEVVTPLSGQKQRRHGLDGKFMMSLLEHRADVDH